MIARQTNIAKSQLECANVSPEPPVVMKAF